MKINATSIHVLTILAILLTGTSATYAKVQEKESVESTGKQLTSHPPELQQEQEIEERKTLLEDEKKWSFVLLPGWSFGKKSSQTIKDSQDNKLLTVDDNYPSAFIGGAELNFTVDPNVVIGGIFEQTKIDKSTLLGFYGFAKIQKKISRFTPWAAIGLGLQHIKFAQPTTEVSGYRIVTDSGLWGFAFTPRVGIDYDITNKFIIGFQIAYEGISGNFDTQVIDISSGDSVTLKSDFYGSFFSASLRAGFNF